MTRQQLEIIKKGTYFLLVIGLGGSVMWLSSGGNVFQSDVVGNNNQSNAIVSTDTQNNIDSNVSALTNSSTNTTNSSNGTGALVAKAADLDATSGFANLSTDEYSRELELLYSSAYTEEQGTVSDAGVVEETVQDEEKDTTEVKSTEDTKTQTTKKATTTLKKSATTPKSGPEHVLLLLLTLAITAGIYITKSKTAKEKN